MLPENWGFQFHWYLLQYIFSLVLSIHSQENGVFVHRQPDITPSAPPRNVKKMRTRIGKCGLAADGWLHPWCDQWPLFAFILFAQETWYIHVNGVDDETGEIVWTWTHNNPYGDVGCECGECRTVCIKTTFDAEFVYYKWKVHIQTRAHNTLCADCVCVWSQRPNN